MENKANSSQEVIEYYNKLFVTLKHANESVQNRLNAQLKDIKIKSTHYEK